MQRCASAGSRLLPGQRLRGASIPSAGGEQYRRRGRLISRGDQRPGTPGRYRSCCGTSMHHSDTCSAVNKGFVLLWPKFLEKTRLLTPENGMASLGIYNISTKREGKFHEQILLVDCVLYSK